MANVGLVLHRDRSLAVDVASAMTTWLSERGHEVRLPSADAALIGHPRLGADGDRLARGLDVAVSIGGDGTMLRTVDLVVGHAVPLLGVNVGQLGYLAAVEPSAWPEALERVLAGSYEIEERMLLAVKTARGGHEPSAPAELSLNEAVLEKDAAGHTVRLAVWIDGNFFTTYVADGFIVATPTGSTAYALSAHGPVLAPSHRALLLTPVCPHGLFDRSLVLSPDTTVRLEVCGHRPATLSIDGRPQGTLGSGDSIECTGAEPTAKLVTLGRPNMLAVLKAKFGLSDR